MPTHGKPPTIGDLIRKEIEMQDGQQKDVADEILAALGMEEDKAIAEEVAVEAEPLEATEWEEREDGNHMRLVPFSEKFWPPTTVPDLHVAEITGYDVDESDEVYIPPKEEFEQMSLAFTLGLKTMTVGPTGAGKTRMFEYYATSCGRPFLRIEHNIDLDKASVFGQTHINVDEEGRQSTDFVPGTLPCSMDAPTITCLDELSRAPGHANIIYQRMLDRGTLALPEMKNSSNAIITPDPYWRVCATDNTKGDGEDLDMYPASNVQDAAFRNRWDILIEQDYLAPKEEEKLIKEMCKPMKAADRKALVKFSSLIHAGFKNGEIATAFSPRNLQAICKLHLAGVPVRKALEMNFISRCSKSEISDVTECLRTSFGSK